MKLYVDFCRKKLLTYTNLEETLEMYELKELKDACKLNNLKVSGKKQEIIQRLLADVDHDKLSNHFCNKYYKVTAIGQMLINKNLVLIGRLKLYSEFDRIKNKQVLLDLIANRQFAEAFLVYRGEPPKLGNLHESTCNNFFDHDLRLPAFCVPFEQQIKVITVLISLLGARDTSACVVLEDTYGIEVPLHVVAKARRTLGSYSNLKNSHNRFLYKHYIIRHLDEEKMCSACKKWLNKELLLDEAIVGVNYPPFDSCLNDACRCRVKVHCELSKKYTD